MKRLFLIFIFFVVIISFSIFLLILINNHTLDIEEKKLKGFQLSPKSFSETDFNEFISSSKRLGNNVVAWSGSYSELKNLGSSPFRVISLARSNELTPVIIFQVFDKKEGKIFKDFEDDKHLLDFVSKYKPEYIGLGIEVNYLYEKNKGEFDKYVLLFHSYQSKIKSISNNTKIFPIFQLEKLKGLQGGLFGGINDTSKNQWEILNKFNKADLLGFTTYPTLIYNSPSDIPLGYYEEISKNTNLKYIFSEIGWIRTDGIKGWEGSEIEQSKYMELLGKTNAKGFIWSFFYDQEIEKPFRYMGLRGVNDKSIDSVSEKAWQMLGK